MTQKVYKTAQGKTVDMGALQLQNENVKAVGNMGVNARGDRVDPVGTVVDSRNARINRSYREQTTNVVDTPVPTSARTPKKTETTTMRADPIVGFDVEVPVAEQVEESTETVVEPEVAAPRAKKTIGGLAAAIAKSKTVKQEPMKTAKQTARDATGVKRI